MSEDFKYAWEMPTIRSAQKKKRSRKKITDRRHDWSEERVLSKLTYVFPKPAFLVVPRVRSEVNRTPAARTIDAIVASMYSSRGLWFGGVEAKITKSDWRKELRDPEKSWPIQRFCRYLYIAAPMGVIPTGEVPETWGQIEVREDGATITKPAPILEPETLEISFVLSILKRMSDITVPVDEVDKLVERRLALQQAMDLETKIDNDEEKDNTEHEKI